MTTLSSILARRIPRTEEPERLQSTGLQRVRHGLVTFTHSLIHGPHREADLFIGRCTQFWPKPKGRYWWTFKANWSVIYERGLCVSYMQKFSQLWVNLIRNSIWEFISSVQFSSVAQSCPTLCDPMDRSMPGLPVHHQLPESTQTYVHWVSDAIQPSHPLSSPFLLPPIFLSIRVFSNESALCIRWPEYWSFTFNISPSNEHPGLSSFRMDCLDLLAVQGTLKSLLQHHSSIASILRHSAFFTVQLSHPYMTTGKTIALTRWTFVDKVMSPLFNMLSRLVITFLPRSKYL